MSVSQEEEFNYKLEIQKVLTRITTDMAKLKKELSSLNSLIEDNASLPMTVKMANEKLILAAKDAGIDLEIIERLRSIPNLQAGEGEEGGNADEADDDVVPSASNASALATAADELTDRVKKTLKK